MRQSLSIVHVARAPVGGVFRHIADLARAQAQAGHSVGLIVDSNTGGALEAERIAALAPDLTLGTLRLPMRRSIGPGDLPPIVAVSRHVARMGADVIHSHGAKGGVFGRLAGAIERRRRRPVATFYAPHGGSLHYGKGSAIGRVYFAVERALEHATDGLIHVSAFEAAVYRDKVGIPRCAAHVVVNGVRPEEFDPVQEAADAADFLFIGALRDLKGTDVFLNALRLLRERKVAARAIVVGAAETAADEARYRALAAPLGESVRFLPPMPARQAFGMARAVVVPSRAESMPYVVLEAAAAGRPLLATRVGGIPEILDRAGEPLLPPGDPAALAEAMQQMSLEPERALAEAATRRGRIRQKFSLPVMAERIEGIYRGALEGAKEPSAASALEADFSR